MDRYGTKDCHRILFERSNRIWKDKTFHDQIVHEGAPIQIRGICLRSKDGERLTALAVVMEA